MTKAESTICGVEYTFDPDNIKEARQIKLKNRRVMLCHDGKNYLLQWKNLQKDGKVAGQNLVFTPEAMQGIAEMFFLMDGPKVEDN